jgi:plasmid stability protein
MANLIVRSLDQQVVDALKQRAAAHGRSAEAEHRLILQQALTRPAKRPLADVLGSMPDVGRDSDFERVDTQSRPPDVFD